MPSIRKASGTGRRSLRAEMFAKASRSLALVMRVPPAGSNPTGVTFYFRGNHASVLCRNDNLASA